MSAFNTRNDDFAEWLILHKSKGRREQIVSSMADTVKALECSSLGENTRKYLELYLMELEDELTALGWN